MRLGNLSAFVALSAVLLSPSAAAQELSTIRANDNRTPAGELRDGVLRLELEIRKGFWYPESERGEAIPSYAFAEAGKPLQVPGPTIRVPEGTRIDISLRNPLEVPATVHGFYERPGDHSAVLVVEPGETREVRFDAGAPGVYLYWARTPDGASEHGRVLDALLGGALVVDRPGEDPTADRIFVFERWNGPMRTAINGKSWPFTERLEAEVGKPVRWKMVNASDLSHPMHLHGFHFRLDGVGDGASYRTFDYGMRPEEFTHSADIMETFAITWVPREPGRWLYHCHRMPHMRMPVPIDTRYAEIPEHNPDHVGMEKWESGFAGMGGMILGITVKGPSRLDTENGWNPRRRLRMDIGNKEGTTHLYEIGIEDLDSDQPAAHSSGLTGPLLLVRQGEHTEITVANHARAPTSVHWHGLEIESYYDGVPWWSGIGERRAPEIETGHEFRVKMIPQRAGSFIYHTHWHDHDQLTGGVHGPMVVLGPDEAYDPETDKSFLVSLSPREPFGASVLLVNGSPQPRAQRLKAGVRYRFRFMNITPTADQLRISLLGPTGPVEWRQIAKDAAEVHNAEAQEAVQVVAVGETFDFEYRSPNVQELRLEARMPTNAWWVVQRLIFE